MTAAGRTEAHLMLRNLGQNQAVLGHTTRLHQTPLHIFRNIAHRTAKHIQARSPGTACTLHFLGGMTRW